MGIINKPVDVICLFREGKVPMPYKFKIKYKNGEIKSVKIDNIRMIDNFCPASASARVIKYVCQSEVEEIMIEYELHFLVGTLRWTLYRVR